MPSLTQAPTLTMNDDRSIPQLGLGVFQIPPQETAEPVRVALEAGYRLIDTAQGYGNEEGVGEAVASSGLPRDEIFVTTKLANSEQGRDSALRAFDESMAKLRLDELDLFLIHWPQPRKDLYVETWRTFEELRDSGRIRSIGVSNFTVDHLERLAKETGTVPAVNQIELHPRLPQKELRDYHAAHGILTQAWSPIGQGKGLLEDPVLQEIGQTHGKSPAQVVLRWHVELGNVVIPKSVNPGRIRENLDVFDFSLTAEEMGRIAGMETGERIGPDPETLNG